MRTTLLVLICVFLSSIISSNAQYKVSIDLGSLKNDRLFISVETPKIEADTATFVFPLTIPGTYEEHLWWRLAHDMHAYDDAGGELPVSRSADSQFVITQAKRLARITYWMDDSFDDTDDRVSIFHPAGTSFQGDSVFVFNHSGVVGYIDGKQSEPYTVIVTRPAHLYCATALNVIEREKNRDVYVAPSYDALVDGPVVYSRPDTISFDVGGVEVLVAIIHDQNKSIAPAYGDVIFKVTKSIAEFLPAMPVDRYAFLIYLWNGDTSEVKGAHYAQGALEHSYSSFYFWRYSSKPFGLESVAAHEFLHILVPLNLHSKEIEEFNFRSPEWSGHLWLYEGVTEYFASQSLLRGKTMSESRYLRRMQGATRWLTALPDSFSLYDFSKNILEPDNQKLFPMIYQYGPLNALCLDILLREESDGEMGLLEMVYDLMGRYGPSRPFDDAELCGVIEESSSKAVGDYCETYILGSERVPLEEYLPKIGWKFLDSTVTQELSFGVDFQMKKSKPDSIVIKPSDGNPLAVMEGDVLIAVNGVELTTGNMRIASRLWRTSSNAPLSISIVRDGKEMELEGRPTKVETVKRNVLVEDADASDQQIKFRNLVLYGEN